MNADDAALLAKTERELAERISFLIGVLALALVVVLSMMAVVNVVPLDLFKVLVIGLVFGAGMLVVVIALMTFLRGRHHLNDFRNTFMMQEEWRAKEIEAQVKTILNALQNSTSSQPPTYLPTSQTETFRLTTTSGAGRETEEVVKELVNGFWYDDLVYWSIYLANGGRYSESALESFTLPYSKWVLGQLKEGSHATRLINLCETRGILSARSPGKNGKLLIKDATEIKKRLVMPETEWAARPS